MYVEMHIKLYVCLGRRNQSTVKVCETDRWTKGGAIRDSERGKE